MGGGASAKKTIQTLKEELEEATRRADEAQRLLAEKIPKAEQDIEALQAEAAAASQLTDRVEVQIDEEVQLAQKAQRHAENAEARAEEAQAHVADVEARAKLEAQEERGMDLTAAKAAFLEVRNRPLPDLKDSDLQLEILLAEEYTEIVPHLFLAGDCNPQKVAYLNGSIENIAPNLGFVVRCSENPSKCDKACGVPSFTFEPREDSEGRMCVGSHCFDLRAKNDLLKLKECCIEIKARLEQSCNVLVHCDQGVDRSATVAAAFCMAYYDISTADARKVLKRLRPACTEQLPEYEELLRKNEGTIRRFFDSVQEANTALVKANERVLELETEEKRLRKALQEAINQVEERAQSSEEHVESNAKLEHQQSGDKADGSAAAVVVKTTARRQPQRVRNDGVEAAFALTGMSFPR